MATRLPGANASCLFIAGGDGGRVRLPDGRVGVLGNNDLYRFLGDPSLPVVQLTGDFLDHPVLPDLSPYRCLVNMISDADRNPRILENLDRALRDFGGRIVNRPSEVLKSSRDFEANATMDFISSVTDPEFAYTNRTLPAGRIAIRAMIPNCPGPRRQCPKLALHELVTRREPPAAVC